MRGSIVVKGCKMPLCAAVHVCVHETFQKQLKYFAGYFVEFKCPFAHTTTVYLGKDVKLIAFSNLWMEVSDKPHASAVLTPVKENVVLDRRLDVFRIFGTVKIHGIVSWVLATSILVIL